MISSHLVSLLLVLVRITYTDGTTPGVKVKQSEGIYYMDKPIHISCEGSNINRPSSIYLRIGSRVKGLYSIRCIYDKGRMSWYATFPLKLPSIRLANNCEQLARPSRQTNFTLTLSGILTFSLRNSSASCKAGEAEEFNLYQLFSNPATEPKNVLYTLVTKQPELYKSWELKCTSDGSPASAYMYSITTKNHPMRTYELQPEKTTNNDSSVDTARIFIDDVLKDGFKVTCSDTVHTEGALQGEHTCTWDQDPNYCILNYLALIDGSPVREVRVRTGQPVSLSCDVEANPPDTVTYTWEVKGQAAKDCKRECRILLHNSQSVKCSAHAQNSSVMIQWNVRVDHTLVIVLSVLCGLVCAAAVMAKICKDSWAAKNPSDRKPANISAPDEQKSVDHIFAEAMKSAEKSVKKGKKKKGKKKKGKKRKKLASVAPSSYSKVVPLN